VGFSFGLGFCVALAYQVLVKSRVGLLDGVDELAISRSSVLVHVVDSLHALHGDGVGAVDNLIQAGETQRECVLTRRDTLPC